MKNGVNPKFKYLIPAILLVFLLIPQPAFAFIGAIFEFLDHLTESIEESQFAMFLFVLGTFLLYLVGVVSLVITTWLLEFCLENQTIWLTSLNTMTHAGWSFVAGIADMLVVLILLIIAFAFILKIETFQAQKALPRLIIVALLINFSLLFVKMLIDLTQIIYATILAAGGEGLPGTALEPFFGDIRGIVTEVLAWLGALIGSLMVPIASTWTSLIFAALFLGIFLPNILVWVFKTFCFFTLSGIFLVFAFLFAARVFVLQALAILSPIAFLALVLPQTKSIWEDWLKHLTSWLLLGVFLLFFLVLGFTSFGYIIPEGLFGFWTSPVPIPGLAWLDIAKYIFYYFAIFVYMVVFIFISKKYLPELASFLIETATSAAGFVMTRGLKPMGKIMKIHGAHALAGSTKIQERAEKWATAKFPSEKGPIARSVWAVKRGVGMKVGPEVKSFQLKRISEARKKWAEKSVDEQAAALATAPPDTLFGILAATADSDNVEDVIGRTAKARDITNYLAIKREDYSSAEEYEKAVDESRKAIEEALRVKEAYSMGDQLGTRGPLRVVFPTMAAEYLSEKTGIRLTEAMKEVISAIKPQDLYRQPISALKEPLYMKEFVRVGKTPQLEAYAIRHRQTGEEALKNVIKNLALEENKTASKYVYDTNRELYDYLTYWTGMRYITLEDLDKTMREEAENSDRKLEELVEEKFKETTGEATSGNFKRNKEKEEKTSE